MLRDVIGGGPRAAGSVSACLLGLVAGALPASEGSRLLGAGVAQLGTAGGGAASPYDSSWLANNVAGLTRVPHRFDAAAEIIYAISTQTPEGAIANPDAGKLEDEAVVFAPHLTYARPLEDFGGTLGLGLYTVNGLVVEFDDSRTVFGEAGGYDTFAEGSTTRLSAGYAREVGDGLSLGLALNLNYGQLATDIILADGSQTDGEGETDGALGFGFQLALHQEFDAGAISLTYQSRQWMQSFDKYDDLLIGPLDQPQVVQLGTAWSLSERFELLVDYRFIDWSSVAALADEDAGFGWEDQHIFKLGGRWRSVEGWTVHGGISYGESQIRDEDAFVNGFSMLNNEWHLALGASWLISPRFELGAALMHAPESSNTDDGSKVFGLGEDTEITLEVTSLTLGLGYLL